MILKITVSNSSQHGTITKKNLPGRGIARINLYRMDYKVRDLLIMVHRYHWMLYLLIAKVHLNDDLSVKVITHHISIRVYNKRIIIKLTFISLSTNARHCNTVLLGIFSATKANLLVKAANRFTGI